MRTPSRSVVVAVAAAVVVLSAGCKPDDDIRTYTAPKEHTAKAEKPNPDEKFRMLVAVIPADDKYFWTVKLAGAREVIDPLAADFTAFVKSIKPGADSNVMPAFTAPAGWTETPAKQMRLATFTKNGAELVLSTPAGGGMFSNVNRWRGQVGLRALKETELKDAMTEIQVGDKTAYTVDLRGPTMSDAMPGGKGPFQK